MKSVTNYLIFEGEFCRKAINALSLKMQYFNLSVFSCAVVLLVAPRVGYAQIDSVAVQAAASELQHKFAPDKRSVYFNLHFKKDTAILESTSADALSAFADFSKTSSVKSVVVQLPSVSLQGKIYGVANLSVGNNRAVPSHSAEMMTQVTMGTPVEILKKQSGFYLVKTPDGYISWIDALGIAPMDKREFESWKRAQKVVYLPESGHAWGEPKSSGQRVSDLVAGNILQLLGTEGSFYKVQFPDKRIGYVQRSEAVSYENWLNRPVPDAGKILTSASAWLGVPYLWGGTSTKGMDCSGFTKTAYFLNGIIIPRDASQQALVGGIVDIMDGDSLSVAKSLQNLKPGDLLFFSASKSRGISGGRITHTAIYMGNGEYIQAAGMIRINSLIPGKKNFDRSQVQTIVSARNILSNVGQAEITRVKNHPWYSEE